MITEDFVSFETSKLLKEKGFDGICRTAYETITNEYAVEQSSISEWGKLGQVKRPTLQMVMKWLRGVHKLFIFISPWLMHENSIQYYFEIREIKTSDFETLYDYTSKELNSFEKAAEVAIKYCLENLI